MNKRPKTNTQDILNINIDELKNISILDGNRTIKIGYKLIDEKPDQTGLIRIIKDGKIYRVHPTRILNETTKGSIITKHGSIATVSCPNCSTIIKITKQDGCEIQCNNCLSQFDICQEYPNIYGKPQKEEEKPQPQENPQVNLSELATHGEMWVKISGTITCVIIRIGNYFATFNLYNMSYGKKNTRPPIDIMETLTGEDNLPQGVYYIKDYDKWAKKNRSKGYDLF